MPELWDIYDKNRNITGKTIARGELMAEDEYHLVVQVWINGSLTLCFPLDFHNPLQHSPLRLIFLSNFKIFLVIVCHCVV